MKASHKLPRTASLDILLAQILREVSEIPSSCFLQPAQILRGKVVGNLLQPYI